ncbi:unnamed protein product, partial [Meganyctiphanes norvegica]
MLEVDTILEHIGKFGRFQRITFALGCFCALLCGMPVVQDSFVMFNNPHRCAVPVCDPDSDADYDAEYLNYTVPADDEYTWSQCEKFFVVEPENASCIPEDFDEDKTVKCHKWVYDTSLFQSSTVSDFDLVCDRAYLSPLASTCYMAGMLVGSIVLGDISDRFGRKVALIISVLLIGVSGILSAVSPNIIMFLITRVFTGMGGVALFATVFILAVEFVGAEYRTFCGILIEIPFALGEATVGVLAMGIRDWRWLQAAITAPFFLCITYWWFMPESVRWLISKGRNAEAVKIIEKAAKVNKATLPKELLQIPDDKFEEDIAVISSKADLLNPQEKQRSKTVLDLLRTPNMRKRSINLFFCWAVCTLCYYGLSQNAGNLGGDIFLSFILTMLIEIPSYIFCWLVLDSLVRKNSFSFLTFLAFEIKFLFEIKFQVEWLMLTLSLVGKFGMSAAFAIIYVYSAEIFPTDYRSVGIGACSMFARVGGMLAGPIASLSEFYQSLPLLIFGLLSIISGLLVVFLPETVGCELPLNLEESEEFGKDQGVLYFTCWGQKNEVKESETQ